MKQTATHTTTRTLLNAGTIAGTIAGILIISMMTACGFHLRGQAAVPDGFNIVAVRDAGKVPVGASLAGGGRDELPRALMQAFRRHGMTIADAAPMTVELLGESTLRRTASIDAVAASAAEYRLEYEVRYRVIGADGATLISETKLAADNSYRFDNNAVMGSADEEMLIYQELRRDVADRIVQQYLRRAKQSPRPNAPVDNAADTQTGTPTDVPAHAPAP